MKVWLKRLGILLLVLVGAVGVLLGVAFWRSEAALGEIHEVNDAPLDMASADLDRGKHLFASRGCSGCHGDDGRGVFTIDAGPVFQVHSANISPTGLGKHYDATKIAAAIRHGVRADGTTLIFMPSFDWAGMSDRDTTDLVAYVQSLAPTGEVNPPTTMGPVGRLLWLLGQADELLPATVIDHGQRERSAPAIAATAEYGAYLAPMCQGCHLPQLTGGLVIEPGAPKSANINRAKGGLPGWTESDFVDAMRSGKRRDGTAIAGVMPWQTVGAMNDTELAALWAYLGDPAAP